MQMIPFTPKPLAERQTKSFNSALSAGVSSGFAVVSIKGKVFHIARGDERTLITNKAYDSTGALQDTGEPAPSIDVVMLNANPDLSRTYYAKGYEEGSDGKPDCYSNNGKVPEADAANPQAANCATCPHSQYGSKISENGSKGWACANFRRLAIAASGTLDDPMLLRVPGASLKALVQYAKDLDGHGYLFNEVVTKIGFDYSVAHPALTFKAVGVIPADNLPEVLTQANSDTVSQIIGTQSMPAREAAPAPETVASLPPKTDAAAKPTAKAKASAKAAAANLDAVVETAQAVPVAQPVKVEQAAAIATDDLAAGLDDMLGGISFDD